jgi:hypothetical protein
MQVHYTGGIIDKIPVTLNDSRPGAPFAVLHFDQFTVFAESTGDAYAVIAAGVEALRLLDPDAPVRLADDVTAESGPQVCPRCGDACGSGHRPDDVFDGGTS